MTQENKNNQVEVSPVASTEEPGFFANAWNIVSEPGAWISKKTTELKKNAASYAVEAVGEELGVSKEFTTGIVGMLKGTNQTDSMMGLIGQSAVRGGAYWAGASVIANVLKFVSGGSLDLTGALPILAAVAGMLITGFKQYNANSENINKDISEKTESVKNTANEVIGNAKEGTVEFLNKTGLSNNETVKQVLSIGGVSLDNFEKKAAEFEEIQANNKQPKLSGPSPV